MESLFIRLSEWPNRAVARHLKLEFNLHRDAFFHGNFALQTGGFAECYLLQSAFNAKFAKSTTPRIIVPPVPSMTVCRGEPPPPSAMPVYGVLSLFIFACPPPGFRS